MQNSYLVNDTCYDSRIFSPISTLAGQTSSVNLLDLVTGKQQATVSCYIDDGFGDKFYHFVYMLSISYAADGSENGYHLTGVQAVQQGATVNTAGVIDPPVLAWSIDNQRYLKLEITATTHNLSTKVKIQRTCV